jgi:hypothetical protein
VLIGGGEVQRDPELGGEHVSVADVVEVSVRRQERHRRHPEPRDRCAHGVGAPHARVDDEALLRSLKGHN